MLRPGSNAVKIQIEHVTGWNAAGKIQKLLEARVFEMSMVPNLASANAPPQIARTAIE